MTTPILETDRIILRPMKTSDAEEIFNNWATDFDVLKYVRWNAHESINVTREWLAFEEENLENSNSYQWAFVNKGNGEIFGSGGLTYAEERKMFEIGYAIMKKYWNQGFATEFADAMIDFAINCLKQTNIFGKHAKENPASGKVLEKAGFVYYGDVEYSSFDGQRVFDSKEYIFTATPRL